MEVVREVDRMRDIVNRARGLEKKVGLVPTMGYFHEGHLRLMQRACEECDLVVVSLFVNPTQFGPGEDLEGYPRDFEADCNLAEKAGVDCIFHPTSQEMYPDGFQTAVEVEELSKVMCGGSRPGHFRGVATVVAKLFNIIPAHRAYFGQKDAQQLLIVKRMARDLNFDVEVVAVPTVREKDGLAMSSRNSYLDPDQRLASTALFRSLKEAEEAVLSGERDAARIRDLMERVISGEPAVDLEYIAICDNIYLRPVEELSGEVLIALAAKVGKARLIDNFVIEVE